MVTAGCWLSLDVATVTGVAIWAGRGIVTTMIVRPHPKGTSAMKASRWALDIGTGKPEVYPSEVAAWRAVLAWCPTTPSRLVLEEGFVGKPGAAKVVAERRGRVLGILAVLGVDEAGRVIPSEWRRVVRETWGRVIAWPSAGEDCKRMAVDLVRERWGHDVTADEADAVLVGWWARCTGVMVAAQEVSG